MFLYFDVEAKGEISINFLIIFCVEIKQILCKELSDKSHHLRTLVVSPTRDLALQLYLVFKKFADCVGLKIGLSAGQRSLNDEQSIIVNNINDNVNNNKLDDKTIIDILVCTPGRLVDHLNHTPGFTLKNLQFLVCFVICCY